MKFLDVPQSGSIAGRVHSHNRAGQYTRNRRAPVQPIGTGRRAFIRAAFGASSAGFAALTAAQQDAWTSFADDHPVTDSLGQSIKLTGHQMFVAVATTRLNVGLSAPTLPPASVTLPVVSDAVMTFGVAAGASIAFTGGAGTDRIAIAFSKPSSPARRFIKTFWQPPGENGYIDGDAQPYTMTTALYAAEFGAPLVGQRIFARVTGVNSGGWYGTPVIISTLVVA